jgi:hypothetical protein
MKSIRFFALAGSVLALGGVSREARAQSCTFNSACNTVAGGAATVLGIGSTGTGVQGQSTSGAGVTASSTSGTGVAATTSAVWPGVAVSGINNSTASNVAAIYGSAPNSPSGWGGDFFGANGVFGGSTAGTNGIGVKGYCGNGDGTGCGTGYAVFAAGPAGGTSNFNSSDARLKKNIQDAPYGIEQLLKLRPVTFRWKKDEPDAKVQFGLIAQEVQKVFPELVREDPDKMLAVNYVQLVPVLVRAVQQQQAEITKLEQAPGPVTASSLQGGSAALALGLLPLGFFVLRRRRTEDKEES